MFYEARHNVETIHATLDQIETSYLNSIINSEWLEDVDLLQILLEGILKLPDIQYVEVRNGIEILRSAGTPQSGKTDRTIILSGFCM